MDTEGWVRWESCRWGSPLIKISPTLCPSLFKTGDATDPVQKTDLSHHRISPYFTFGGAFDVVERERDFAGGLMRASAFEVEQLESHISVNRRFQASDLDEQRTGDICIAQNSQSRLERLPDQRRIAIRRPQDFGSIGRDPRFPIAMLFTDSVEDAGCSTAVETRSKNELHFIGLIALLFVVDRNLM